MQLEINSDGARGAFLPFVEQHQDSIARRGLIKRENSFRLERLSLLVHIAGEVQQKPRLLGAVPPIDRVLSVFAGGRTNQCKECWGIGDEVAKATASSEMQPVQAGLRWRVAEQSLKCNRQDDPSAVQGRCPQCCIKPSRVNSDSFYRQSIVVEPLVDERFEGKLGKQSVAQA